MKFTNFIFGNQLQNYENLTNWRNRKNRTGNN